MRMSDEQYFRSCVAFERHLAQLLGYHNIEEYSENAGTLTERRNALPKWTRDWRACGPLLSEFELDIRFDRESGMESGRGHDRVVHVGPVTVHCSDHPSKERAVMVAVVKAAIYLLEHRHGRDVIPAALHSVGRRCV